MSKKKSKNFRKNNKKNLHNLNNNFNDEKKINIATSASEAETGKLESNNEPTKVSNVYSNSEYDDLFIDMNGNTSSKIIDKRESEVQEEKQEDSFLDEKNINVDDIKVEKSIECTSLKVIEKKNFFLLVLKLIGIYLLGIAKGLWNRIKYLCIRIKDFFEDRAEELDRKIKELKDEQVIKEKKTKLDYERYNTKRIYKDLERAEIYKNRASNRVNTEMYFEEKIEQEKVNNKVLISESEVLSLEDTKKAQNIDRTANAYSSNKKSRIEKKKNEIIELRKRRKEEKLKREKEQKKAALEKQAEEERIAKIKAEEEKMISEAENIIKSLESQIKDDKKELSDDDYNSIFNDFGSEDDLTQEETIESTVEKQEEKIEEKQEKKKEVKLEKVKDILDEPYEKFEKENDIREIDEDLKSEILRLIDVPESEVVEVAKPEMEKSDVEENKKTYSIFDAIKNAKKDNSKNEEDSKKEEPVVEPKEDSISKIRVSENQDGFENAIANIEKNKNTSLYTGVGKDINSHYENKQNKIDYKKDDVKTIYDNANNHEKLEVEDFPLGAALLGIQPSIQIEKESGLQKEKKENITEKKQGAQNKPKVFTARNLLKSRKTKKKHEDDFDKDVYTNRFMKNIIGMDDEEINTTQEPQGVSIEVEEYNFNNPYDEQSSIYEDDYNKVIDDNEDERLSNIYSTTREKNNSIHEKNKYYEELLDQRYEESKKADGTQELQYRIEHGNDDGLDEKVSFGSRLKDMASSINLIPNTLKKKRESKNRIKKNQIYSTSYYKKGKKR